MKRKVTVVFCVGFLVLLLWAGSGVMLYRLPDRGTIGDMFGAINALFSGLAFVGLVYAIILQHEELMSSKAEQKRISEIQDESTKFLILQAKSAHYVCQLQTLSAALESMHQQIAQNKKSFGDTPNGDAHLRLHERRKELEAKLKNLIEEVIKQ